MLFALVPAAFLAAEPLLERDLIPTLVQGAAVLAAAQFARGTWRQRDAWSALLMTILSLLVTPGVFGLLVLFGTPVSMYLAESMLAALHISLLAVQPLACQIGLDATKWQRAVTFELPWSDVYCGSLGTAVGAWLGAIPIALDWDRPWQTWPITVLVGAYAGCSVGTVLGGLLRTRKSRAPQKTHEKKVSFAE